MLNKLAAYMRFMQIYAHNGHNTVKGETFFEDHAYLGSLYPIYEEAYDGLIERMIGIDEKLDLMKITEVAFVTLKEAGISDDPKKIFSQLLKCEEDICKLIEGILKDYSEGTKQMLGTLADQSEMRQYKLKQRIK